MKIYTAIIEERCETLATITAENSKDAWVKAMKGDYDLMPETSRTLPDRIKSVRFANVINGTPRQL